MIYLLLRNTAAILFAVAVVGVVMQSVRESTLRESPSASVAAR